MSATAAYVVMAAFYVAVTYSMWRDRSRGLPWSDMWDEYVLIFLWPVLLPVGLFVILALNVILAVKVGGRW